MQRITINTLKNCASSWSLAKVILRCTVSETKILRFTYPLPAALQKFMTIFLSRSYITTRQALYVLRNFEAQWSNHCCRGRAISITYSKCVFVTLVILYAQRTRRIMFSFVTCLALPYFSTLSHKWHDFREKMINYKMCVLIFPTTLSEKKISF
jgi:hypothetical protein